MTPRVSTTLLRTQSDQRLLELVQAGHEAAFEAIVERYRSQLHRYARRMLPEGRCEDAVQQGLMQAWRALQDGKEVRQLRPWLYAIVHNAAVNQLRQGVFDYRELLDTVEGSDDPEADVEMRSIIRQTLSAVAALPERQRDALLAVVVAGRPQSQVALEMGLTENGLRQLLFRARTAVRTAATAVTPLPLLTWVLRAGHSAGVGTRIGEAAAGGAAVAGGAHVLQTGTALIVAGTLAVGGATALKTPHSASADRTPAVAAVPADATARPVALHEREQRARSTRRSAAARRAHRRATSRAHILLAAGHGFRVATPAMIEVTTTSASATPAVEQTAAFAPAPAPAAAGSTVQPASAVITPTQQPTQSTTSNEGPGSHSSGSDGSRDSSGGRDSPGGGSAYPENSGNGSSSVSPGSTPGGSGDGDSTKSSNSGPGSHSGSSGSSQTSGSNTSGSSSSSTSGGSN